MVVKTTLINTPECDTAQGGKQEECSPGKMGSETDMLKQITKIVPWESRDRLLGSMEEGE